MESELPTLMPTPDASPRSCEPGAKKRKMATEPACWKMESSSGDESDGDRPMELDSGRGPSWPCEGCRRATGVSRDSWRGISFDPAPSTPPTLAIRGGSLWVLADEGGGKSGAPRKNLGELRRVLGMLCEASLRLETAVCGDEKFCCDCDSRGSFCARLVGWLMKTLVSIHAQLVAIPCGRTLSAKYVGECQAISGMLAKALAPMGRRLGSEYAPPALESV